MSAADEDLTFALSRSIEMGKASIAAGASITKQNRAARRLHEVHGRVQRAISAKDKYRHQSGTLTVDAEYRDALQEWFDVSERALGMDAPPSERPSRPTISDEDLVR